MTVVSAGIVQFAPASEYTALCSCDRKIHAVQCNYFAPICIACMLKLNVSFCLRLHSFESRTHRSVRASRKG